MSDTPPPDRDDRPQDPSRTMDLGPQGPTGGGPPAGWPGQAPPPGQGWPAQPGGGPAGPGGGQGWPPQQGFGQPGVGPPAGGPPPAGQPPGAHQPAGGYRHQPPEADIVGREGVGGVDDQLHPLLPAAQQAGRAAAHSQPHPASAGGEAGSRGAIWFALVVGLITLAALTALVVILLSSDLELPDLSFGDDEVGAETVVEDALLDLQGRYDGTPQQHVFTATAGRQVTIDVIGETGFDPIATLLDEAGTELARDDDSGEGLNPRLSFRLPTSGSYSVVVTGFGSSTGSYRLVVR